MDSSVVDSSMLDSSTADSSTCRVLHEEFDVYRRPGEHAGVFH